jgi:hypothetical protein
VWLTACGRLDFGAAGDAPVFAFGDFATCPSTIVMLGTARCSNSELELTPNLMGSIGGAWFATPYPITATTRLTLAITFRLATTGASPADGMTIAISGDPRGTGALGYGGGSLGYESITPSIALELDDAWNSEFADLNDNHVGIDRDGSMFSVVQQDAAPFLLGGGAALYAWLDYDGPTTALTGYLSATAAKPAMPLVNTNDDLSRLGTAWFGLTAATGSDYQQASVLAWRFDYTP